MISVSAKHRIFIAIDPIDFRKGIDGLARFCQYHFEQDPMNGHYFIFCNRRKTAIKILYYDSQGYCLIQKRLSRGRFTFWPQGNDPALLLTPAQLQVLLSNGNPANTQEVSAWRAIA